MRLNGWQRLWLVASVLWAAWMALQVYLVITKMHRYASRELPVTWDDYWQNATALVVFTAVPIGLLYATGLVVAWVHRGFRG